jgi:hypothetical protein
MKFIYTVVHLFCRNRFFRAMSYLRRSLKMRWEVHFEQNITTIVCLMRFWQADIIYNEINSWFALIEWIFQSNVASMRWEVNFRAKQINDSMRNNNNILLSRLLLDNRYYYIPYFTDYRSMGTIGRIAAFWLNFLGNTKIGRSIP